MEAIGAVASIAQLIDVAQSIVEYARHTADAKKEIQEAAIKLELLISNLHRLKARIKEAEDDKNHSWYRGVRVLDPNENKHSPLTTLDDLLSDVGVLIAPEKKWKKKTQQVLWHWDRDKLDEKLKEIDRCYSSIDHLLAHDQFDLTLDIQQLSLKADSRTEDIQKRLESLELNDKQQLGLLQKQEQLEVQRERNDIAEWLSPFRFLARQQELLEKCYRIGKSILESIEFQRWFQGAPWQLYLLGAPGAGKTHFSTILIDYLQSNLLLGQQPVVFLFLDHKDKRLHNKTTLLGSILKQLIQQRPEEAIPEKLVQARKRGAERPPAFADIDACLHDEVAKLDKLYVVVDGLDECSEKIRLWLIEALPDLDPDKVCVVFTTREIEDNEARHIWCNNCKKRPLNLFWSCYTCKNPVDDELSFDLCKECFDKGITCGKDGHPLPTELYQEVYLDLVFQREEIVSFLKKELAKEIGTTVKGDHRERRKANSTFFGRQLKDKEPLQHDIVERIADVAEGRMIFATLCLGALQDQRNVKEIRKRLDNLSTSLDALYDDYVERIKENENKRERFAALETLAMLSASQRVLRAEELLTLLAIDDEAEEYDIENEYEREGLMDWTKNLIVIRDRAENGVQLEEVRLSHATLDDYLRQRSDQLVENIHSLIGRKCLAYLRYANLSKPIESFDAFNDMKRKYPLIEYAALFWAEHVRLASEDDGLASRVLDLLRDPTGVTACMQLAWYAQNSTAFVAWDLDFPEGVTNIHLCAWAGLTHYLEILIDEGEEFDVPEGNFQQTPLMLACRRKNVDLVRKLLEKGANLDLKDARGRTALIEAIEHDRRDIVALVLEATKLDINIQYTIKRTEDVGRTALMLAARRGFSGIVGSLLERSEIAVNAKDPQGMTALMLASKAGAVDVVSMLLNTPGIDVLARDTLRGWSALAFAAFLGHTTVVATILAHDDGRIKKWPSEISNAYTNALRCDQFGVLEMMAGSDADLTVLDDKGQSLLHVASGLDSIEQVRFLLERGAAVNLKDLKGLTALHEACRCGSQEVAAELLDAGADSSLVDDFGRTPARTAWLYGHPEVFSFLRDATKGTANAILEEPSSNDLPVWSLAKWLKVDEVADGIKVGTLNLLETEPIDKQTALHEAVNQCVEGKDAEQLRLVELLLKDGTININSRDSVGRTALHYSAFFSNIKAIELLSKYGANLDEIDKWQITPISLARHKSHFDAVSTLVELGADPCTAQIGLQELFFALVEKGTAKAIERLVCSFDVDTLEKDNIGRTSHDIARERGDQAIVAALQKSHSPLDKEQ